MLSKQHRFHGNNSLRFVLSKGHTVKVQNMALKSIHNKRTSTFRVAIVVSRKVSKSAVVRNRIRRRIYAVIDDYRTYLTEPHDLVFFVYSDEVTQLSPPELKRRVAKLLKQAKIIF